MLDNKRQVKVRIISKVEIEVKWRKDEGRRATDDSPRVVEFLPTCNVWLQRCTDYYTPPSIRPASTLLAGTTPLRTLPSINSINSQLSDYFGTSVQLVNRSKQLFMGKESPYPQIIPTQDELVLSG